MLRLRGGSAWPTSMDSVSPWGTTTEAAGDVCGSDANGTGSMVPRAAVVASHRGLAVIPEEPEDVEAMEDVQVDVARQHREDEYKERQQQGGSSGQHALPLANVHATTTTMTSTVSTTSITTTTITTECEGRAMPIDTLLDVNDDDEEEDNDEVVSERRIVLDMLVGASCRSKRSIVAGTTVAARFPPKHGRSGDSSNSSGTDGSDISDDADDMAVLSAYATAGRLVDGGEDAHFMTSTARHSCFGRWACVV